jgi:L-ribulose-5-phosphate 3-epimerase
MRPKKSNYHEKIGFMQGRLSNFGKFIQEFPINNWENEFKIAQKNKFSLIEWTIDNQTLKNNPLMNKNGIKKINLLKKKFKIKVKTLTCDYIMQKPYWKILFKSESKLIKKNFVKIINQSKLIGVSKIIVPLVDNSKILNNFEKQQVIKSMKQLTPNLKKNKQKILFETDLKPIETRDFIKKFNLNFFGINYDIGNSASLGYDTKSEIDLYGKYIKNIHIKDRKLEGQSVQLGKGNANFNLFFQNLKKLNYKGFYILQTARSTNQKHIQVLKSNRKFLYNYL